MKGILLAGGKGTRLYPLTASINKHLLPIYDKPMIYYSLSTLMLAGIQEILLVSTPSDLSSFQNLLGEGDRFGMRIKYASQPNPEGIPQALEIGENYLGEEDVMLVLGDNIFYGAQVGRNLKNYVGTGTPHILTKTVQNFQQFGIANYAEDGSILELVEKPSSSSSRQAILGVYFLTNESIELSKKLIKSSRGEYEIVDLLNHYVKGGVLKGHKLPKGTVWLDTGTINGLSSASDYVRAVQELQEELVCSPEQIALENSWISKYEFEKLVQELPQNEYKRKLEQILK